MKHNFITEFTFKFPEIFISLHNSAYTQTEDFRLSDYVILFYVRGVNFSIKAFILCKKLMLFLYVCCSQHNLSEVAGIRMLHLYSEIPPYSGYFGLGACEIIRIKLNYLYLKRLCWFSSF